MGNNGPLFCSFWHLILMLSIMVSTVNKLNSLELISLANYHNGSIIQGGNKYLVEQPVLNKY